MVATRLSQRTRRYFEVGTFLTRNIPLFITSIMKIVQMAKAGFVYTPQTSGDDTATCFYCDLSLSGWDVGDNPLYVSAHALNGCHFMITRMYPERNIDAAKSVLTNLVRSSTLIFSLHRQPRPSSQNQNQNALPLRNRRKRQRHNPLQSLTKTLKMDLHQ